MPQGHFGHDFLEAGAGGSLTPGSTQIAVNHPYVVDRPAECLGALLQPILVVLTLAIVSHLFE